jgi:alpha-glucosidase (family GH31 glycosyl hydrolase)
MKRVAACPLRMPLAWVAEGLCGHICLLRPCRWGYKDVEALEQVVSNYSAAGIPLESLWLDIEYMGNRFRTLTYDPGVPAMDALQQRLQGLLLCWSAPV